MHSEIIAEILLNGAFERKPMVNRLVCFSGYPNFSRKLVKRVLRNFGSGSRPSVRSLDEWIFEDKGFQKRRSIMTYVKPHVERSEYDRLKAIIHRCVQNGYEAENRQGHPAFAQHLQGRVEFVRMTHPTRGEKLEAMLAKVDSRASL